MSDQAYREAVQCSNIHWNEKGLSGDVQLGSQGSVQKAPVNEDPERFRLVSPQQNDIKRGASKGG